MCVCVCVADKDRELSEAQAEIKALRLSERLREKAVEEVPSIFHFYCIKINFRFPKLIVVLLLRLW